MAEERWKLLIADKVDSAYEFLSPGTKAQMSLASYRGRIKPGSWRSVEVKNVKCADRATCTVGLQVGYSMTVPRIGAIENEAYLEELWKFDAGRWWYVPAEL